MTNMYLYSTRDERFKVIRNLNFMIHIAARDISAGQMFRRAPATIFVNTLLNMRIAIHLLRGHDIHHDG